jgi:sporulation protein YlmC with PRC-barrel domain
MDIALVEVDVAVAANATRASSLIGAKVGNDEGENIGTIDDLMLIEEVVAYAILAVGGFLGLAARLVAVPFEDLQVDEDDIVLPGATREELKRLPEFRYS